MHKYTLQPYKGKQTRYTCPKCNKPLQFTRYINTQTNEHLATNVGKCNREVKCGYHYKPGEYFKDNWKSVTKGHCDNVTRGQTSFAKATAVKSDK